MADVTTIAELVTVFLIVSVAFLVSFRYIYGYEHSRAEASSNVSSNLGKMLNAYELRGGVKIRFTLINQSLPAKIEVYKAVKTVTIVPIVKEFEESAVLELADGKARLIVGGREFDYECGKSDMGSNIELLFCGLKGAEFKNAVVSSVVTGVVSDGRFTGSVSFTLKG